MLRHLGRLTCALCGAQVQPAPVPAGCCGALPLHLKPVLLHFCTQIAHASKAIAMTQDGVASAFVNAHGKRVRGSGWLGMPGEPPTTDA
jgi:hypothetical protein